MISRSLLSCLLLLAVLLPGTGCDRGERVGVTAEVDDPGYKRAKELVRQGRKQEALTAFQKVIERRGDDSAESHLEAGLLYSQHFKDPIAAIYHFRKCRELKPNSPTAELVKPQIDAATREFARTLPGDPLNNAVTPRFDAYGQLEKLQRENEALRAELAALQLRLVTQPAQNASLARSPVEQVTSTVPAGEPSRAAVLRAPDTTLIPRITLENPPSRGGVGPSSDGRNPTLVSPSRPGDTPAPAGARRHVVAKGDTLYSLAARYYGGNSSRYMEIYAANPGVLKSVNDVPIGVELVIPP